MDRSHSQSMIDFDTKMDQLQSDNLTINRTQANIDRAGRGQHSPVEANMNHAKYP